MEGKKEMDNITSVSSNAASSPYKVGVPPKQKLWAEFSSALKETFFSDDPLRPFKDQPRSRNFALGLGYNLSKFKGDLIAGLTIASLCIAQDIGYSKLANLPPQYGLYSSFVPPLVYAFMGSSRDIAIGPIAVIWLLLGALLQHEIDPVKNALEYRRLAFTATFFAGIPQATLGFLRLGFLVDFLSHAAVVGFMGGTSIAIALQQLKGFLGIKKFTKETDIVSVMHSVFSSAHHGVKHIDKGINPPSANEIYFTGDYLLKGVKIGVEVGVIALTEAVAIGRTFAAMEYQIDGNKEMIALGAMNVAGSLTSCYVATGSFSRSAVNYMAGCQTAVSNIYTPNAILSSIIISAVLSLIDYDAAILIWKIDKFDFVACMGAFLGVVFASVEIGLLVLISFAKLLLQVTRPRTAILGQISRTNVYRNILQILRWLTDEEEQLQSAGLAEIKFLIIEMSPVTDIDTSGIHALEEVYKSLQKREVELVLANPGP
ncbi:hypothetical protein ACS0TY_023621 [Phlomoides rotata]